MKRILLILILTALPNALALGVCYLRVDEAGSFNKKLISEFAMINISNYVQKVNAIPIEGININESCYYKVVVNEQDSGLTVTVRGASLNGSGESKLRGLDGFKQAFLRSIIKSKQETKRRICSDYGKLLESDCRTSREKKQIPTTNQFSEVDIQSELDALKKYKMALVFKRRNKLDKMEVFYRQILEQHPNSREAAFVRIHLMTHKVASLRDEGAFDSDLLKAVGAIHPTHKKTSVYKSLQVETEEWLMDLVKRRHNREQPDETLYAAVLNYKKDRVETTNIKKLTASTASWMIRLGEIELAKDGGELSAGSYFEKAKKLGITQHEIADLNDKMRAAQIKSLIDKGKRDQAEIALVEWEVEAPGNPYWKKMQKIFERPSNMVTITGGTIRGRFVPSFNLDVYEVTNREFLEFVKQNPTYQKHEISYDKNDRDYLKRWSGNLEFDAKYENLPVVFVSQIVASAYCKWAGKRLPTDLEWGLAAGEGKRNYPWGNEPPDDELANYKKGLAGDPMPGDSHPMGATPEGVMHMGGNVWELTSTIAKNGQAVARGGCYYDYAEFLHNENKKLSTDPVTYSSRFLGFRCAQ